MIAQCWLHIGTEKTGTTTIQEFLATNRSKLLTQGYLYPTAPGTKNHMGVACYALNDEVINEVRRACGVSQTDQVAGYRTRLLSDLDREIAASRASAVIFSNEHLSSRLKTLAEVQCLRTFCARFAKRTTIVVYLRNQLYFLVSRYIEAVKGGSTHGFTFPVGSSMTKLMDYAHLLSPWRDTFGRENMIVRRFEPADFHGGDLVLDFAAQIGIDIGGLEITARRNEALDKQCVVFLREFNKYIPHLVDGRRNPVRGRLIGLLEQLTRGDRYRAPRHIAAAIDARFRSSNERVSAEYFSSRYTPLFGAAGAAGSGEDNPSCDADASEFVRIAAHLWRTQQEEINELEHRMRSLSDNVSVGGKSAAQSRGESQPEDAKRRVESDYDAAAGIFAHISKPAV